MLIQPLLDDLSLLKLQGMREALAAMQQSPVTAMPDFSDGLGSLLSHEKIYRQNKRLQRLLTGAKLRYQQACIENIDDTNSRQLDKTQIKKLAQCEWLAQYRNVVFIGATGLGKTYLACALGHAICRQGFSVRYWRLPKLLEALRIAGVDGTLNKTYQQLAKINVLIVDDWGIEPLNAQQRHHLLEIVEDRYLLQSMIITTQLPQQHWHDYIGDNTVADAILDRLLTKSDIITLKGESMRKINNV